MAKLDAYRAKRDFQKTREPEDVDVADRAPGEEDLAFVVQKHDATRLHYDLRLELDGVMKSWAVTKGPSLVTGEKRLAIHVEDHPVAYNAFEGTIPKGQYGGGTVMIWDRGVWEPVGDPHKGYAKGHLEFSLAGEKLGGGWHLVKLRKRPGEKQEAWLLMKAEDSFARPEGAPDLLDERPLSVASGRSLDAIAADEAGPVWDSRTGLAAQARAKTRSMGTSSAKIPAGKTRSGKPVSGKPGPASSRAPDATARDVAASSSPAPAAAPKPARSRRQSSVVKAEPVPEPAPEIVLTTPARGSAAERAAAGVDGSPAKSPAGRMPKEIEPCLATLAAEVPGGPEWLHEIKWDGYRLIAFKRRGTVRIATRRGHDWTARFPGIAAAVAALPVETAVLDGEAVIEDERGVSSFAALQAALSDKTRGIADLAIFFAFDLLYEDGEDLRPLPLETRKARLATLLSHQAGAIRLSEHIDSDGAAMVRSACGLGLEGVISKRRDKAYRSGRNEDWLKIKCTDRQEFVVVGFVPSTASRKAVGSLVLAYNEGGALRYAGRAGTGFTAEAARETLARLEPTRVSLPPIAEKLTTEERRGVVWVAPALVVEIEFRGWTGDARLRHAAFKGLRDDKQPDEVVREVAGPLAAISLANPTSARPRSKAGKGRTPAPAAAPSAPDPSRPSNAPGEVAGIRLSHPDRVLWDDGGITKQGLAEFCEEIADWLLPHVARRPLSLVRCPAGADGHCFFQKHSWAGLSDHIRRETIRDESGEEEVLFVEDIRGVVSLVQAGVLEIHPWGATIADVDAPDRITMDLDPGEDVPWTDVIAAAWTVRERLAADKLESFVKTTGGKGLHVVLPLEAGSSDWASVKRFARALAESLERDEPTRFISKASKTARRGLIYVDYLRNGRGATAVAAYSTRARRSAPVSVPIRWDELSPALGPNNFTVANLPQRFDRLAADPWHAIGRVRQALPVTGKPRRR